MFDMELQDTQWLESLPPTLGFDFDKLIKVRPSVNEPVRYTKPNIWFDVKNGLTEPYTVGIGFSLPDDRLVYVAWNQKEKRFAYENSHYVSNPPPLLVRAQKAGKTVTLSDAEFDPATDMVLGQKVPPEVWVSLRDAAEGKPRDSSPTAVPV